ncbi:hypothetical protein AGMMS4952_03390 [Spirochaetia bacterium]|nr:hypothetical protein AGMMS4952_03390 [Spirochaetia bacterium]
MENENSLYSLISLADFKSSLGKDDREDALSQVSLVTATFTIEQYCHRRLLKKNRSEYQIFTGDHVFYLKEYPVREILAVYLSSLYSAPELVEPDFYHTADIGSEPDGDDVDDIPFCLSVSPGVRMIRGISALKIHYLAGYQTGEVCSPYGVPADLASACMELAEWNMKRFQGGKIGVTGASQGKFSSGEHLELSMPENVRLLLEPYRRRMI